MKDTSCIDVLAGAFRAAIESPDVPPPLKDRLILTCAKLRDTLPPEQARAVEAAEAEAVIKSFSSSLSQQRDGSESQLDDAPTTFAGQSTPASSQ